MTFKKGGYAVKNGFYIKHDCKNNKDDENVDDEGYILDPLTYERIKEGQLIQLSDGLCYNKSKQLAKVIKTRNTLPFGNPITIVDEAKLSTSQPSSKESSILESLEPLSESLSSESLESLPLLLESSPSESTISSKPPTPVLIEEPIEPVQHSRIPPRPNVQGFTAEWHPATNSYILRRDQLSRQPSPRIARRSPLFIIESDTEEQLQRQPSPRITRRRGRPRGSRRRPLLIIESDSEEQVQRQPSPEVIEFPEEIEIIPAPRRRGRPRGSRNRISRRNSGGGIKNHKKNKSKKR
jgi:hypothetical protein